MVMENGGLARLLGTLYVSPQCTQSIPCLQKSDLKQGLPLSLRHRMRSFECRHRRRPHLFLQCLTLLRPIVFFKQLNIQKSLLTSDQVATNILHRKIFFVSDSFPKHATWLFSQKVTCTPVGEPEIILDANPILFLSHLCQFILAGGSNCHIFSACFDSHVGQAGHCIRIFSAKYLVRLAHIHHLVECVSSLIKC